MTDEELEIEMKTVTDDLAELPEDDKALDKEQRKEKDLLFMKQEVLKRIKAARAQDNKQVEFDYSIYYGVLNSWFGKHPFLRRFVINSRCRWNVF